MIKQTLFSLLFYLCPIFLMAQCDSLKQVIEKIPLPEQWSTWDIQLKETEPTIFQLVINVQTFKVPAEFSNPEWFMVGFNFTHIGFEILECAGCVEEKEASLASFFNRLEQQQNGNSYMITLRKIEKAPLYNIQFSGITTIYQAASTCGCSREQSQWFSLFLEDPPPKTFLIGKELKQDAPSSTTCYFLH